MNAQIFLIVLTLLAAAPKSAQIFRAETANITLPVNKDWLFNPNTYKPSPSIPVPGANCTNAIRFDFIPAANLDYTRRLIDTESIEATAAIRRWHERKESEILLDGHRAVKLEMPSMPERSIFLLPAANGTLVIQSMAQGENAMGQCAPQHPNAAEALVSLFFSPAVLQKAEQLSKKIKPPNPKKLEPIPTTIDECFAILEKQLSKKDLAEIRSGSEKDMARFHFGLGMWLRNAWGLWGGSPLAEYFNRMGVFVPDDISGIILTSFWRHLNGKPLEVDKQAAYYKRYWDLRNLPEPKICSNGKAANHLFYLEDGNGDSERVVHIYDCDDQKSYWIWEFGKGWSAPDDKLRNRIIQLRRSHPGLVSAPLNDSSGCDSIIENFTKNYRDLTLAQRLDGFYSVAQCQEKLGQDYDDTILSYAKAVVAGERLSENVIAKKARASLERLYRITHADTLIGIDKLYARARRAIAEAENRPAELGNEEKK
jgi:hypothetical protein